MAVSWTDLVAAEESPKFSFVITDGPKAVKDAATRKRIRKHVMRDIGKARRKDRKTGERSHRRIPLEVMAPVTEHGNASPPSAQNSVEPDTFQQQLNVDTAERPSPELLPTTLPSRKSATPRSEDSAYASDELATAESYTSVTHSLVPLRNGQSFVTASEDEDWEAIITASDPYDPMLPMSVSNRPDPFFAYPIAMDSQSLLVIDYLFENTLDLNFRWLYRDLWYPLGLLDEAAFHQVLSMFALRLRKEVGLQIELGPAVKHHATALQSVQRRLKGNPTGFTDGLIAAIVGFICHGHLIEDLVQWRLHMRALKELVRMRGGIDTIPSGTLLRSMIFFVDNIGSCAMDLPPNFPIPDDCLPMRLWPAPRQTSSFFIENVSRSYRQRFPSATGMMSILEHLWESLTYVKNNIHISTSLTITYDSSGMPNPTLWSFIKPIIHSLLSWPKPPKDSTDSDEIIQECCRVAGLLATGELRSRFGVSPVLRQHQVERLQGLLINSFVDWTGLESLRIWMLALGGMYAENDSRLYFIDEIKSAVTGSFTLTRVTIREGLRDMIWYDERTEWRLIELWNETGLMVVEEDPCLIMDIF